MKTLIWAHRGASAYAPENTIEAFELACEMKADGIELDVWQTADGQIAVNHDGRLDRVANGTGLITEKTMAELKTYNFGKEFAEKHPDKYPSHVFIIPTLAEVFEAMKPHGITINVELKSSGGEFVDKVIACERDLNMTGRIVYSSFDHFNLTAILDRDPDAFVAPLYGTNMVKPWLYAASFGAKALHPHLAQLDRIPGYVEKAHELGVRVHPWTVDGEADLARMFSYGIDAIITNRPDAARRVLEG